MKGAFWPKSHERPGGNQPQSCRYAADQADLLHMQVMAPAWMSAMGRFQPQLASLNERQLPGAIAGTGSDRDGR